MSDLPAVLTVEETSKVLRLGRTATYAAIKAGEIRCVRLGRTIRVPRAALEQLLGADLPATNGSVVGGGRIEEANGPGASPSASARGDTRTALEH